MQPVASVTTPDPAARRLPSAAKDMKMKRYARAVAAMAAATSLWAVPATGLAATAPQRVATLNGDYPGLSERDPDATGRAALSMYRGAGKVCYTFRWQKMEVRGLYVYRRSTGAVVAKLYDEAPTTSGFLNGCATGVPSARVREMTEHPRRFMLQAFPYDLSGRIAGNLQRPA